MPKLWTSGVYSASMSDAARSLFLICYDVSSPRRLYRVRKYLLGFKVGGQKSFFECWLTAAELRDVSRTLNGLLDLAEDRAHIFQLDPRMKRDFLGLATQPVINVFMII
jgi:CRISPR-associated protein Cas2